MDTFDNQDFNTTDYPVENDTMTDETSYSQKSFWENEAPPCTGKLPEKTPEIQANASVFFKHLDIHYVASLTRFVLEPLEKYYFRARFVGFDGDDFPENTTPNRPLIFASNHSGMAFPWDAIIFSIGLLRRNGYNVRRAARALVTPLLANSKLMSPFLIDEFWRRAGGIDATSLNYETMMHHDITNILIYPEGIAGIGKGFDHRYELQRLSTSTLRMSIKFRADIVPFATVNAEFVNPFSYSIPLINKIVRRLSIPFLPIGPLTPLVLLQPWMFYFALPAKLTYVRGPKIKPYEMVDKPIAEITQEELYTLRDKIHAKMQLALDAAVVEYGQKPYDWKELFFTVIHNYKKLIYFVPLAWPFLFREHERRYKKLKASLNGTSTKALQPTEEEVYALAERMPEEVKKIEKQVKPAENPVELVANAALAVAKNPEVLLMYVPGIGLVPMLLADTLKKQKKRRKKRRKFFRSLLGIG